MQLNHGYNIIMSENPYIFWLDSVVKYEETSTSALSANPTVAVPLLTINGWILMQRLVLGSSVTFNY